MYITQHIYRYECNKDSKNFCTDTVCNSSVGAGKLNVLKTCC